ncbi:MAG: helix-turn-helix transcriptional regulator [Eubacterium sp.]|nr:helix-turn-helix transcriptional regulator [Eubacterium sp.]
MQNMNYYYDFSGQKFGYPLSLSINGFSRSVFSRQSSLEISYILKGAYEAVTADFSCTLKERELIVIAPDTMHMICPKQELEEKETVILTIHVDFARMSDAMAGDCQNAFHTFVCTEDKNRDFYVCLKRKIGELVAMLMKGRNHLYEMNVILMQLVAIAARQQDFSMEDLPLHSDFHENYLKAIQYIDAHYSEQLTLSDLAAQLSFSLSYTSRLFRRYTGIPFVKYLAYVRVRASLESLLEGRSSIEQIAADCGMPNAKSYAAAFRELYGILPSDYRKQFRQNLKYAIEKKIRKMELDEEHKELLHHFIEESGTILYEESAILIHKMGDEIVCRIRPDAGNVRLETDADGTLILHLPGVSHACAEEPEV